MQSTRKRKTKRTWANWWDNGSSIYLTSVCFPRLNEILDPSNLPLIENDPRFQEVLGKNLLASDEEDYDEEAIPGKDDDNIHDDEEKPETSIDEPEVQVLPEAEPTDEVIELEAP